MRNNIIAAVSAAAVLMSAGTAFAAKESPFCGNLAAIAQKIDAGMQKRADQIGAFQTQFSDKKSTRWSANDQKLSQVRDEGDKQRAQHYAELNTKATTDAQKAAVAQFQSTIDQAIATRRAAVDAAIKAYRDGVDAALSTHTSTMSTAETAFKTSVDSAISTAQASCTADGSKGTEIRTTLQSSIKTAQSAFQSARKDNRVEDVRKQLAQVRKDSIDKAFADFRATAEQARATLKAAFKN